MNRAEIMVESKKKDEHTVNETLLDTPTSAETRASLWGLFQAELTQPMPPFGAYLRRS